MTNLFNAATVIAIATFLWYRKGRLWNFYDHLLTKCSEQIKKDSINRERWERIALEQCAFLSQDTFQSLFRFEVEYLQKKLLDNQYEFWISDSETTTEAQSTYADKGQFCKAKIKELFFSDLRFCGLQLFAGALAWHVFKNDETDRGKDMELSRLIAKITSVIYLSAGLSAILNAGYYHRLVDDLFSNAALTYLSGFIAVIIGFLIVHYHNRWVRNWTVLITLVGWLALLKGVVLIVFPGFIQSCSETLLTGLGLKIFPYAALFLGFLFAYFGFVNAAATPKQ